MADVLNIEDMIAGLSLNDEDDDGLLPEDDDVIPVTNAELVQELRASSVTDTLKLIDKITIKISLRMGQYGSINLGKKGANYTYMRNFLLKAAGRNDMPLLRKYLTEPVHRLPVYDPQREVGAGGQGETKKRFNRCWSEVRDRVQRVLGMMVVIHPAPAV